MKYGDQCGILADQKLLQKENMERWMENPYGLSSEFYLIRCIYIELSLRWS